MYLNIQRLSKPYKIYAMPEITLTTIIKAPIKRCFDLSRSIDLHLHTATKTKEEVIGGRRDGLINKGETVTWKAKHFGITQTLTSEISEMNSPFMFEDRMLEGTFKKIQHKHLFEEEGKVTIMKDVFIFESPFGIYGRLFNFLVLTNYMKRFLQERNQIIKRVAESEEWKKYLQE